jgi:hypothetical protein
MAMRAIQRLTPSKERSKLLLVLIESYVREAGLSTDIALLHEAPFIV